MRLDLELVLWILRIIAGHAAYRELTSVGECLDGGVGH